MEGLLKWTFGQNGILKAGQLVHNRIGSTETIPQNYKLSEDIYFSTEIWHWDSENDRWVPFNAPEGDVLMEFVMMDPYYRIPLK
jgi:oligosaccharyltransferase complex subunit beta